MSSSLPPVWAIGSWSASQGGLVDTYGAEWLVYTDAGWFSPLGVRTANTDRLRDHGTQRTRNYRPPRVITLTGYCTCPDSAGMMAALDRFNAIAADGGLSLLTVTEPAGAVRTALVELLGGCAAAPVNYRSFDFQLVLSAPDPRKYGPAATAATGLPSFSGGLDYVTGGGLNYVTGGGLNYGTVTSTGTLVMTNAGTAETWPTYTIAAGANPLSSAGISITLPSGQLFYAGSLQTSDQLTIVTHPARRSVLLNGAADRAPLLTTAQWAPIPAGASITVAFAATSYSSTATLTASWAPAYW